MGDKPGVHIARMEEGAVRPELRLWGLTLGMTLDLLSHMTTFQSSSSFRSGGPTTPAAESSTSSPQRDWASRPSVPPLQNTSSSMPSAAELVSSPLASANRVIARVRDEFHLNRRLPRTHSHPASPRSSRAFPTRTSTSGSGSLAGATAASSAAGSRASAPASSASSTGPAWRLAHSTLPYAGRLWWQLSSGRSACFPQRASPPGSWAGRSTGLERGFLASASTSSSHSCLTHAMQRSDMLATLSLTVTALLQKVWWQRSVFMSCGTMVTSEDGSGGRLREAILARRSATASAESRGR